MRSADIIATNQMQNRSDLDGLFNPKSIAMIGASNNPRKISGRPIAHLKASGFAGEIYPVNAMRDEVQGLKAYASLDDIDGEIDQVLIGLPAAAVADAVEDCIRHKVRSIVLFSAGFGELDAKGLVAQNKIIARCREAGIRLLGPNCLGLANFTNGAYATISHSLEFAPPKLGMVAIVSQSGAVGTYALVKGVRRGMGFSRFVATGNEADIDVADCIDWLASDPQTSVIVAYLESCKDGRRLVAALERARAAKKPVIIFKGGASEAGSNAAVSHTGALAGTDAIFDGVFKSTGAVRVHSFDEMLDLAQAASAGLFPTGRRLGVASVSGGFGVMMADKAAEVNIELPQLSTKVQSEIKRYLSFTTAVNPIDVTPQLLNDFSIMTSVLSVILQEDDFDILGVFFGTMGLDDAIIEPLRNAMIDVKNRHPDKLLVVCMMATRQLIETLRAENILVFEDPDKAVSTMERLADIHDLFNQVPEPPAAVVAPTIDIVGRLTEVEAKALLSATGISFVEEQLTHTPEQAALAAAHFGGPVALKINAADIPHKSDIGGVLLNLVGAKQVAEGFATISANVRKSHPESTVSGVLVAPMISGGVELVMGTSIDPVFGPVVMFGLGGVHIEILKDVAFRPAPLSRGQALDMINDIKSQDILRGVRGQQPVDLDAIVNTLVALSQFAATHAKNVRSIEINPYIALPKGGFAVDALIVPFDEAEINERTSND